MGMRGPRPESAAKRRLKGNPSKRPLPPEGPTASGELIVPSHLSEAAQECMRAIKASMPPETYAAADGFLLGAFATAWDLHRQAAEELRRSELVVEGSRGAVINPLIRVVNTQAQLIASLGDRLGLSPSARASLGVKGGANRPPSKFDGLLGGGVTL